MATPLFKKETRIKLYTMKTLIFTFNHFNLTASYFPPEVESGVYLPEIISIEYHFQDIWDLLMDLGAEAERRIYDAFYKEYEESLKKGYDDTDI